MNFDQKNCDDNFFTFFMKNYLKIYYLSIFSNVSNRKYRKEYCCEKCYYNTSNKFDYKKHCETIKHKNAILAMAIAEKSMDLSQKSQHEYTCECGKKYKDNSGLWRHKKRCINSEGITNDLVLQLVKENREMQKIFIEQSQTIQQQNNTLTNIVQDVVKNGIKNNNSHNTTNIFT